MFKGKRVHSELIDISLHGTLFKFVKHPKLNAFVSIGNDHDLSVWDLESLKLLYKKEGNEYAIADALIHDEYHIIASVNGTLKIYKGDEEPKVTQLPEIPLSICVHKDQLYVGTTSDKLLIYDLDTVELKCTQNQQPWVTQLRSHDDTLYIMGNKISYNENTVDIGHKGQIMHHYIHGNKILTGDSSGKVILSSYPEFTKLYEYQMGSAVVQLAIIENQDQLSLIIGTLDPGIVIITNGEITKIEDRAAPFIVCSQNRIINRSNILTRQAYCDVYE
ncbi:unnamed protein product [Paramecium octaurelia]|uniref:Uncharacterized protein n=1 Tax=Paramecium octaurelia TaxID=43137 RepID=A0A8S1UYF0_PAROT|nr:unnamed protein product [Paramecium octaurelia]